MMTLKEFCLEQEDDLLEEGIIRTASISAYGLRSRRHGDDALRSFRKGIALLDKSRDAETTEERLRRIEESLRALLEGLIHQRMQIGAGVAVDVVGHTLLQKQLSKKS